MLDYLKVGIARRRWRGWGPAFKAQTDDIRESPAITCVETFLNSGMQVKAYDPEADGAAKSLFGDRLKIAADGIEALEGARALIVLTDRHEFHNPDFGRIK